MAKPRLIILVRHGQSEGNKNRDIHQTVPDHRVKLTPEGWNQAHDAGRRLRKLLRPDDTLHFFTSPYRRTRETTEGILSTLTADDPEPTPFRRADIKVYEEPRLREQDFGNFQPCSAEMERMWQERADYGHFFYRIPNGESAADAYDRVSGFNESLWRQFGEDDFASVCVLVTHGLMSRVFLMKWYHFNVEYFEDLRNINHCEFLIMRKEESGKYHLQTQLRTWSELRRERVSKDKDREEREKDSTKLQRTKTFVVTRRWGGCPNGCNHSSHYVKREDLEILRKKDSENGGPAAYGSVTSPTSPTGGPTMAPRMLSNLPIDHHTESAQVSQLVAETNSSNGTTAKDVAYEPADVDVEHVHSPYLHVGRDGGGTYSGHTSAANTDTDTDASDDDSHHSQNPALHDSSRKCSNGELKRNVNGVSSNGGADSLTYRDEAGTENRRTNRLGDASPDPSEEGDNELEDIDEAEREDRSISGSVY